MRIYIIIIFICIQTIVCNAFDGLKLGFQVNPSFTILPLGTQQIMHPEIYRRDILSYTPSPISLTVGINSKISLKNNFLLYGNLLICGMGYSTSEKVNVPLTTGEFYTKVGYYIIKPQFLIGHNIMHNNKQLFSVYGGVGY